MPNATAKKDRKARIATLAAKFRSSDTSMNGAEILESYCALKPGVETKNIPFDTMYRELVALALGVFPKGRKTHFEWAS